MATPRYLVDKSVWARLSRPTVEKRVAPLLLAGELAICPVTTLEVLFSAKNHQHFVTTRAELAGLANLKVEAEDFDRSLEVMDLLSQKGKHRGAGIADLLIASVAERNGLTVLHYDHDFDVIALVTNQKAEWAVPRGSVP
jgi:predicted nucleic acid-binding protein